MKSCQKVLHFLDSICKLYFCFFLRYAGKNYNDWKRSVNEKNIPNGKFRMFNQFLIYVSWVSPCLQGRVTALSSFVEQMVARLHLPGYSYQMSQEKKRPYFPGYSVFNRDPYLKKQPIIAMELGRGFIPYIHKKPPGFFIELLKCCFFLSVGNISHPTPYTMGSSKPTNHTRHLPPTNHPFCVNSGRFSTEKVVGGPPGPQPSG